MRVFTKTTKIIGVSLEELSVLQDLIQRAKTEGKAETQISTSECLAIEVSDIYQRHSTNHKR